MKCLLNFIFAFLLINLSCDGLLESIPSSGSTFYYNSFETDSDLNGWQGISTNNLYNDAPLYGGKKSIYISGGCVVPHAWYTFNSPGRDINVIMEFYAKNMSNGGVVELLIGTDYNYLNMQSILIKDSKWQHYKADKELLWPADSTLTIVLNSGGLKPSSMLIDCLRLAEVE